MSSNKCKSLFLITILVCFLGFSRSCSAAEYKIPGQISGDFSSETKLPLQLSKSGKFEFSFKIINPNAKVSKKEPWLRSNDEAAIKDIEIKIVDAEGKVVADNFFEFKGRHRNDYTPNSRRLSTIFTELDASSTYQLVITPRADYLKTWKFNLRTRAEPKAKRFHGRTLEEWFYMIGTIFGLIFVAFFIFISRRAYASAGEQMRLVAEAREKGVDPREYVLQHLGKPKDAEDIAPESVDVFERFCPECGTKRDDEAEFCAECGHKFSHTN